MTYLHIFTGDKYAKPIPRYDSFESNRDFARRYLTQWGGEIEVRDRDDACLIWHGYRNEDGVVVEHELGVEQ